MKKNILIITILFIAFSFSQETITFTNCGQEGRFGPSQEQCDAEYGAGVVNVVDGIQQWVVPHGGAYTIESWGARGGNARLDFDEFGRLLDVHFNLKRKTSKLMTNKKLDEIYNYSKKIGSLGGKLVGAG